MVGESDNVTLLNILDLMDKEFLEQMLYDTGGGSGPRYNGWYPRLFITGEADGLMKEDRVVADIHIAPVDGIGYVLHAGRGPINLAVAVCDMNSDQPHAFIGPVMSYYERVTVNFKRLTDEEWQTEYATTPSYRPPFVNLYLANESGKEGERICSLNLGHQLAGEYLTKDKAVLWDGRNDKGDLVSSGVYFYHLQVTHSDGGKDFAGTKKMIIVK